PPGHHPSTPQPPRRPSSGPRDDPLLRPPRSVQDAATDLHAGIEVAQAEQGQQGQQGQHGHAALGDGD
ncbi:hypothetical protein AB0N07_50305, partial [Streptomyces sp. NPDC051172]|uniref:hypothetical protein n=1 Tax=Streptomyces sp. NPDC051172 TaxID=3155796 RepID=UPI003422D988